MADYKKRKKRSNFTGKGKGKNTKFRDDYVDGNRPNDETNDPAWYAQYPELMKDSASIPYSIPTGTKVKWDVEVDPSFPLPTQGTALTVPFQSVPGIMTFGIIPSVGISTDATSPVNVAAKLLYTKVRAENSGARNYDSPDLLLYCLAMDQVYSLLTWYNRIYGKMMLYSQVNRYLPKALLNSELVDFDDLILHINDFKAFLDTATAQAAAFSVPNDIKIFNRHAFMYQNIYKDAESPKSQIYQFAPRLFYTYDEYSGAGRLVPFDLLTYLQSVSRSLLNFTDLITVFHRLMDPIIASEDFNIMSGDILKAFGESGIIKLGIMPPGYVVVPIADYEVLTQMKNATMTYYTNGLSGNLGVIAANINEWAIHQDANKEFIEWNPRLIVAGSGTTAFGVVKDRYLSTYKTSPEPSDNMVYSRLMFITRSEPNPNDNTKYDMYFDSVGSEFVCGVTVTQFYTDTNNVWKSTEFAIHTLSEFYQTTSFNTVQKMFAIKHFDYAPAAYIMFASNGITYFFPMFDLDNWTLVHAYELEKMHRTAIMSMLRVPMIGSALGTNIKK